jgi:hypothetical protein
LELHAEAAKLEEEKNAAQVARCGAATQLQARARSR